MRAEIQSPQVCLENCQLHVERAFVGVEEKKTVRLRNNGLIPSQFAWSSQVRTCGQSQVEIECYSIAYFDCITAFRVAVAQYFFKDGAHMHYVGIHPSSLRLYMNPTLNESFALQCFERISVVELRD